MAQAIAARFVTTVLSVCLAICAQTVGATACVGPHIRVFPTCEIDAPRADERTTVVYANGGKGLSSATLGSDAIVTEVVDVEIEPADKPHYIALSSGKPIIWRFTGHVDTVSRVVVLGSQYNGATRAGIIGIPKERVSFVLTDLEQLKRVRYHTCLSLYTACELSAYFDIPKADRMELAGPITQARYPVDQFVEHLRAGVVRKPRDGTIEAHDRLRPRGRYEPYSGMDYIETSQHHERGVVAVDAATVVSPDEVRPYKTLPGRVGLHDLINSGELVAPGASEFKHAYDAWNEAISAPFRSHLDPGFLFSYKVDYLITRTVQAPAALLEMSFLVADKVDAPDVTSGRACLYFADRRRLVVDPNKQADPRCDSFSASTYLPGRDRALAHTKWSLDRIGGQSEEVRAACKQSLVDADAFFVGIAISDRAGAKSPFLRRANVLVRRSGKVALYLETPNEPIVWHIAASPATEIRTVLLGRPQWAGVQGIDYSTTVVDSVDARADTRPGKAPCYQFNPSGYAHLGGPAALALDEGLKVLAGRGLDRLVRSTNDGGWPPASGRLDAPRVTFEID